MDNDFITIKDLLRKTNNEHILYFWEELNDNEKNELIEDIKKVDFDLIDNYYNIFQSNRKENYSDLSPAKYLSIEEQNEEIKNIGLNSLKSNEVAFLTVAGGQASRLGYEKPKGCFPISPVKNKSLFQIFAEKIKFYSEYYNNQFIWLIMTSETNYSDTLNFFIDNKYFGLNKDNVIFFKQGMLPTITGDKKLILASKSKLFMNPDGHGGILTAILKTGLLDHLSKKGIKYLSYFQVDNPLVKMADPYFIGYHILQKSNVSTKVIEKLYPDEKIGSIVKFSNNHNGVIEYSDLPSDIMYQKDENGKLKYLMGSIGIHIFSVDFLLRFTEKLPIHFAIKNVDGYDFSNKIPVFGKIKGIKFEKFVFDAISLTENSAFFETSRNEEFFPLKNKEGVDSIETCIKGQIAMYSDWLLKTNILEKYDDEIIEISPLFAPDREIFYEKVKENFDKVNLKYYSKYIDNKKYIYIE